MVGPSQDFSFKKADPVGFKIPETSHTNLYIHIPFCKNMCPYCPYNSVRYAKGCEKEYAACLLKEIELYYQKLGKIEISSVYIGGGTPTNMIDGIPIILERLQKRFHLAKNIAIEMSVSDINKKIIEKCKDCGINMVSVGVQSFHAKYLKLLKRNYSRKEIEHAVTLLKEGGFDVQQGLVCHERRTFSFKDSYISHRISIKTG
jgi:coproporphyrinogen III oxidase-like Fe-S oxidoreductase